MADTIKTYRADAELAELLREAAESSKRIRVEAGTSHYELAILEPAVSDRSDRDIWANYDPDKVRQAMDNLIGIFEGVDVEKLIEEIRENRSDPRWDLVEE
jgi:signal transduction histidine kinase